jgi:hypothetical protein
VSKEKWAGWARRMQTEGRRRDRAQEDDLAPQEKQALATIRREAREHGAVLASGGKGGLPPSFVLGILRRDGYRCKADGDRGEGDFGGLTLHHKGGIVASKWLSKKGHKMDRDNVVTLCTKAHNRIHEEAKREGIDASEVTPEGDDGTRRDHGKPEARPPK